MSSFLKSNPCGKVSILICSVCRENLAIDFPGENKIVHTVCGHVFHKTCLQTSYRAEESFKNKQYRCPYCRYVTTMDLSKELYLQIQIDHDTMSLVEVNKRLFAECTELKKQVNVSEMQLLLVQCDSEQLPQKLRNLTWTGLTTEFQNHLLRRIETCFGGLNIHAIKDLSFLRTNTLLQIITLEPNRMNLLHNIVDDYFDKQSTCLNVYSSSLENYKHVFKNDFPERLGVACNVPLLKLHQIPVTSSIMWMLACVEHEGKSRKHDKHTLAIIAGVYCKRFSNHYINDLCKIRLVQLVSSEVDNDIEFAISGIDKTRFNFLLSSGILENRDGKIDFVHDLVRYYITGIMICTVAKTLGLSLANARKYIYGRRLPNDSLEEYCVRHIRNNNHYLFGNENIEVEKIMTAFNMKDVDCMKLLSVLAVMNLKKTKELAKVLHHFQNDLAVSGNTLWAIELRCSIGNSEKYLTLPHFASLRGNEAIMKKLYGLFDSAGESKRFHFEELIHFCSSWTLSSRGREIFYRKKVISFLILLLKNRNWVEKKGNIKHTPMTVHYSLIEFVKATGFLKDIWNIELMLEERMLFLHPTYFRQLESCVHDPKEWVRIVDAYCCRG